jgi:predicted cupin superfamily sugar epimerase
MDADDLIRQLGLQPHPEGGHFRETFRDAAADGDGRSRSTAIYYLLRAGERSHWHRVHDAAEVWHWYAGAPLRLRQWSGAGEVRSDRLGNDVPNGERPQIVVARDVWQAAESLGAWTLVGCTVAPAFDFAGFEMAPPGWEPQA